MSKLRDDRLAKLEQMRALGVEPFGAAYPGSTPARQLTESYTDEAEGSRAKAAGRLTAIRGHGKSTFADLTDWTGKIQVHLSLKRVGEDNYAIAKLLDIGDVIGVEGQIARTRSGEVTIFADKFTILSKALLPLPEKFHGLRDIEARSRHRSVDLIANPESMQLALNRTRIIKAIRDFLSAQEFAEVETPMMQAIPGGATARPFVTHHNALDMDLYLRIAPELYLKRLLCGGMERVFEINRNFRNEGISNRHNPEFTMLELYQAYADYDVMMQLAEEMVTSIAKGVMGKMTFQLGEHEIDVTPPWPKIRFADAMQQHAGIDMFDEAAVRAKARDLHVDDVDNAGIAALIDEVFKHTVEPTLINPTFLTHHPAEMAPLCRRSADDPRVSERFEIFVAGFELGNAYSELNDPVVQRQELEKQLTRRDEGTIGCIDEDFLLALEHGMPPAGGMGIGIDRLLMLLLEQASLRDVILFPLMRPEPAQPAHEDVEEPEEE